MSFPARALALLAAVALFAACSDDPEPITGMDASTALLDADPPRDAESPDATPNDVGARDAGALEDAGTSTAAVCGNGVIEEDEACDDGEDNADLRGAACTADCAAGAVYSDEGEDFEFRKISASYYFVAADEDIIAAALGGANSVYVLERVPDGWAQSTMISDLYLGSTPAVGGGRIYIGSPFYPFNPGDSTGRITVWERDAQGLWVMVQEKYPEDAIDTYGAVLALSGSTLVVGAPSNAEEGVCPSNPRDRGTVLIYEIDPDGTLVLQQRLRAPLGDCYAKYFGGAIALEGDTLAIASSLWNINSEIDSRIQIYTRTGTAWSESASIDASTFTTPATDLGAALAIENGKLFAGDIQNAFTYPGIIHLFESTGGPWIRTSTLAHSDPRRGGISENFGSPLAAEGPFVASCGHAQGGGLFVFAQSQTSTSTWSEVARYADRDDFMFCRSLATTSREWIVGGGPGVTIIPHPPR